MVRLATARLLLRPFHLDDLADFYAYSREEQVGPNAGWAPHTNPDESLVILQEIFLGQETIWAICHQASQRVIGSVGLIADPKRDNYHVLMLGYAMSQAYWGQGLMTEAVKAVLAYAFTLPEIELISAYCYPFNQRSQRVLEKCNFWREGILRQAELAYGGEIYDDVAYSLTKEEFSK